MLSLLWVLCSVPLVTMGAASTALYDAAVHVMRRKDDAVFSRFFGTFRRELKTACLTTLLWGAVACLFVLLYRMLAGAGTDGQVVTAWSVIFLLLLYLLLYSELGLPAALPLYLRLCRSEPDCAASRPREHSALRLHGAGAGSRDHRLFPKLLFCVLCPRSRCLAFQFSHRTGV